MDNQRNPSPTEVQLIFKVVHLLYPDLHKFDLFKIMSEHIAEVDLKTAVSILTDTYNFYTKWIAVKEIDWDLLLSESHEIEGKYECELCRKILIEVVMIIEADYMNRKGSAENGQ